MILCGERVVGREDKQFAGAGVRRERSGRAHVRLAGSRGVGVSEKKDRQHFQRPIPSLHAQVEGDQARRETCSLI